MLLGRSLRDVVILRRPGARDDRPGHPVRPYHRPGVASLVVLGLLALIGLVDGAALLRGRRSSCAARTRCAPLVNSVTLPLLLLSGILLPMALAPAWLQFAERHQPVHPRRRCRAGAVQRPVGRPRDRDRGRVHDDLRGLRGVVRCAHRSVGPRRNFSGRSGEPHRGLYLRRPNADQVSSTDTEGQPHQVAAFERLPAAIAGEIGLDLRGALRVGDPGDPRRREGRDQGLDDRARSAEVGRRPGSSRRCRRADR